MKTPFARFFLFLGLVLGAIALYVKLSASSLQVPPPTPLPSPNGFDIYAAAAQAIVPANPPVDKINDVRKLTPQQAAVQYSAGRRRAWVASNSKTWKLMARAKTLPCRSTEVRGAITTFPAWKQLRELARSQSIRVKDAASAGKWGDAANFGLDTIEMGRNVERGSSLIGSLVSMAVAAIGQSSLDGIPSHLSAAEAKAAAGHMETIINKAQPFSQVLTDEKWNIVVTGKNTGGVLGTVFSKDTAAMMDNLIAQADKPMGSQAPVAPPSGPLSLYASTLFPTMKKSFFNDQRRNANERLLLLRLALQAYRMERGSYPVQLSALAPTYLKSVPVDPFGKGEALRYSVKEDSYVAWSIGPDGTDNNGVSIAPTSPGKRVSASVNSKGDIIVRP